MQIAMGYPTREESLEILNRFRKDNPIETLLPVLTIEDVMRARDAYSSVYIDDSIKHYLLEIVEQTRADGSIELGISPRGALALFRGAQAYAAIKGRDHVLPDDVKVLVKPIFGHRIKLIDPYTTNANDVLDNILKRVEVPTENL